MAFYSANRSMDMNRAQKVNTSPQEPIAPSGPPKGQPRPGAPTPWFGSQRSKTPMNATGPGGSTPMYTPALNDPRNAGYFYDSPAQAPGGQWDQQQAANVDRGKQAIMNDPEAAAAVASGDWKALTKRMQQIGQQAQAQKFVAMGGGNSMDTWNNRFNQAWPTPTMANGQRAAGAPSTAGGPGTPPASPMQAPPPSGSNANTIGSGLAKIQGGMQGGPGGLSNMPGGMDDIQGKLMASIPGVLQGGPGATPNQMQALPPPPPASTGTNEATPPPSGPSQGWGLNDRARKNSGGYLDQLNANRAAHGMPPI